MNVIRCLQRLAYRTTAFAAVVGSTFGAHGQTVLFDFGNDQSFRGLSVPNPDSLGHYWNSFRTGTFNQNLIDINNNATTIDFGFSTPVATDSFNGPAGPTGEGTLETDVMSTDVDQAALGNLGGALEGPFDYVAGPSLPDNRVQFEIQQLDPARKYNLTFFGSHKFSTDDTTVYSVYSDNTYTTVVGTASLDVQTPGLPHLHNRDMVATINGLAPQVDNILYVEFVGSNGGLGYLNDMQLAASVPGDYDPDGDVDGDDLDVWEGEFGDQAAGLAADGDGDDDADGSDFLIWQRNVTPQSAASAVPEPAGIALLFVGLMALAATIKAGASGNGRRTAAAPADGLCQ